MVRTSGWTVQRIAELLRSSNSTAATFSDPTPTTTEPSGDGVFSSGAERIALNFFGTDAADETGDVALFGWSRQITAPGDGATPLWVPTFICELALTLGSTKGVSGQDVDNNQFFVDTITLTTGNADLVEVTSPAGNRIASVIIDNFGAEIIEARFALGTAASLNGLWRPL